MTRPSVSTFFRLCFLLMGVPWCYHAEVGADARQNLRLTLRLGARMPRTGRSILSWDFSRGATLVSYVIAGVLSVGWLDPLLWNSHCGTAHGQYFFQCTLWLGVMALCAVAESMGPHRVGWTAVIRFAVAGLAPIAVPLLLCFAQLS